MADVRLAGIDRAGLQALIQDAEAHPEQYRRVARAVTRCRGGFLTASYIRDLPPVMIDEPRQLLGTNTAPNPSDTVLAALGACLSVGYMANATAMGLTVEELTLELEGDIDIAPVWGTARVPPDQVAGFTEVRVRTRLKAPGLTPEQERELHARTLRWSPVANTIRNPVRLVATLNA
jgi:uncharacterized OsmC-like protein